MKSVLGKQRNNKSFWVKAVILFLSFLFVASTLGVSLSLFRDNTSDEQNNDFAPIVLSDNSFNTLKSQISFDMMGKSVLVQPVSFVISKDTSSSVYVRAYVNLESAANDARQKLAYESLTAATPIAGKNYKWKRFGQYYYLCDSSNQLASLSSANAGEVFNLLEKETNLVPEDIIDDKFASGEKVSLGVTLQSVQTSKVSSKNVEQAHSAFNAVEPTLANTKTQCSIYFYDANGLSLGNQTVAYGKGVNIPTPASQSGKQQIGWNTKSDYTGATLDEEDLSSVYEDLVLYAEFDALTYNVTVIQPTDEAGNQIGTITPGSTTMRYGQSLTFRVVPATNYYIYGVYIENEETHQKKNIGSVNEFVVSGYASDIKIWADISQEIIFLDINGGTGTQPKITFNEEKTKFVLSETEPAGPSGKEFYYYSTNPLDNEEGQNGIRIDLGVEYPLSYLEDNKVLYAIYLTPTENYQTATNYIVVPKNVTSIEGVGEKNMFGVDTPDVKFVTLPRSVKKIGNGAFKNLDGLTGLSMSTAVDSIGDYAFENCVSLEQFVFGPFVNKIGSGAFKNCVSLSTLKNFENIPTTEFIETFEGCTMLINVTLPSVTTKIEGTFKNCSNLLEVVLPNGLRNIGESTFENCTALSTIEIPSTTSFLGAKAFRNCVALNKIVGLEDVVAVEIPDFMFENCVSLTQLSIPSNTALIGAKAFASCSSLEKITNLSVVKVGEVCDEAFVDCTNLKELIFNGSLKIVGARAFSRSGITKASLSQRLADLGESAFEDCVNLSTIQNLGVITKIAQKTFKNCSNLFSITIPSTVTTIETLAFENCSMLTSLNVPVAVQTIGVDALKNATGLKSITLQGDLSTIYDLASTKQNWYYNTNPTDALDKKGYYTTFVSDWIITNINGNNYITGYRGEDVNVTIPYIITDERGEQTYIYGVALNAYEKISGFENVVIDEGIQSILILEGTNTKDNTAISYPCFKDCKTLKSITLPSTLSLLSDGAFAGCTNLTEIIGLENTKISKLNELFPAFHTSAWDYDDIIRINGEDILFAYDYKTVDNGYRGMFEETSIKEINLPSTLQIIGANCFNSILTLKSIHIPASVRAIGVYAFNSMPSLENITGLESCILDYKTTIDSTIIESGFAAAFRKSNSSSYQNAPIFMALALRSLNLPSFATIFGGSNLGNSFFLISSCPYLEEITLLGDWAQEFSLESQNESSMGINSYSWYLGGKIVTTASEAGTYTIFPGDDDSDWVADENGMIIAYKGINSVVTVPSSIIQNGKTIQIKGIKTFRNKILTDVTISEGLSIIDANAFADMTRLKKVKLASSITTIGDAAFENCTNLTNIVLPEKATNVGSDIFKNCSSIKIIVLNNNISTEQNLAKVSDGEWFYQNGSSSISASQMKSKGVYSKYSNLATTDDWEVKTYENKNYITAYLGTSREIIVPAVVVESDYSNIYEIYGLAALKKFNFTSIIVSEGIETIGLDIVLESEADYAIFTSLGLGDPTDLENGIYLPFMRYSEESKYIENLSTLILPDSLKIVGLFGLGGVRLNGTNTLIEIKNISTMLMNAFAETKVDEIRINLNATKTLSKISEYAFSNSTAQSISIGYGPTLIGASAFSGCTNLTELNIPLSVVTIENGAFDDCESLRVLNLGNARQIGRISNCSNLEKIVLGASLYNPYSVSNIYGKNGSTWFYEGGSDTAVSYFDLAGTYLAEKPDLSTLWTYTEINGKWYITGYTGDSTNLTVPSSLVINGTETQIDGIKSINTKEGVDIESVIVSEGIAEILAEAFVGKTKLSKITLPSTLTSIGKNAFSGAIISLLTLSSENLTLNAGALDGMSELNIINVQTAIKSQYTLPTGASWTYISYSDDQSSSSSTTTLWEQGIYTTLANVATTIEWIVGSENDLYYIAGYKLECTGSSFVLEVPRLVINHKTFEVYEISSIKSLYLSKLSNSSIEITLKISEGITKLDVDYYTNSYSMTDVLGENYYNIYRSLRGAGYSQSNTNNIVSIEFPSTLIDIGTHTFNHLTGLRELKNFENTRITSVGQQVFESNNNLTQLEFPATLKSFSSSNFSSCSALKTIVLNSTLESSFDLSNVGNGIWYFNSETIRTISMRKAGIYSSSPIQNIGLWVVELIKGKNYITAYLGGATELVVPHEIYDEDTGKIVQIYGVRGIGKIDLETITFEEGIEEIGQDGATINIFGGNCPNLKKISMSSTLTTIYGKALDNISADNIVITIYGTQEIPYTLSGIKNTKWFYGSTEVSNMQEIGSYTTFQVSAYMPDPNTFSWIISMYEIIDQVDEIISMTDEEISKGQDPDVAKIYISFRDNVKALKIDGKSLTIPALRDAYVRAAGYSSIDNAWYLTDNNSEGENWFICSYLGSQSEITLPRYVLDYYTIEGCAILRELDTFLTIIKQDGDDIILTQDITKITLEDGYTTFGVAESQDDINVSAQIGAIKTIKEIVLPKTLSKLGLGAFVGFVSLEKINLENTKLTTIPFGAFVDVINLKKVTLPETVKKLEQFAFAYSGIVELELNEGLISIADAALYGLSELKVLTIPTTISSIPQSAILSSVALSSLEKIIIKKDLSIPLSVGEITKNVYYKNGSQIALSTISEAGTYLSYICGTTDDWKYEIIDGKNYITKYNGKNVVVDIPTYIWDRETGGTIEIYGVKSLKNSKIRKLMVREGIKEIGNGINNIINGTYNNTLTYVSLPYSLIKNDSHILDGCNILESVNLIGNLQNGLSTANINPAAWHSHNVYLKNMLESDEKNAEDEVTTISTAGGYSTYSIGQNIVQAKTAQGGYGADLWDGQDSQNGNNNAFIPAFGYYNPDRMTTNLIGEENAQLLIKIVPMESVITLRGYTDTTSSSGFSMANYSKTLNFNSLVFAEGFTRIGDKGNVNNGIGTEASIFALGPIVNRVNKVGSEDKINMLPFDGSFDSEVPSVMTKDGGTLSLSSTSYAGSKALSYEKTGGSKATITTDLVAGVYVFEAMVKSSIAGAPLQVQLSSDGSKYAIYYSEEHNGNENYQYVFVKFEVQSQMTAHLNLIQSAIYDCMSLYRVDRGLPTTLTTLGANAFSKDYSSGDTGLLSINLSQTAIEEMEMFALGYTIANSGSIGYNVVDEKYILDKYAIPYEYVFRKNSTGEIDAVIYTVYLPTKTIKFVVTDETGDVITSEDGYKWNTSEDKFITPEGSVISIIDMDENSFYISDVEVQVDWSFDIWTNVLTYGGKNIPMVESSEDLFWAEGYIYNAKTNRLITPDGIQNGRYFVNNGQLKKDVIVAVPRTLTTLGHMSLNTGATRYIGLEKSSLKSLEVGAFGGEIITFLIGSGNISAESYGENLLELNLPNTLEDITKNTSSDIALGSLMFFGLSSIGDNQTKITYPTDFEGYAFTLNSYLENINIAEGNSVFSSKDGVLFNADQTKLISFPRARKGTYSIPETVTNVGQASFMASALSTVVIPNSLITIEDYAFCGIIYPTSLIFEGDSGDLRDELLKTSSIKGFIGLEDSKIETIGRGAFAMLTKANTLLLPSTLKTMGESGDATYSPISGSGFNYIVLNSALNKSVSLEFNTNNDDVWFYNLSSKVTQMQPAGVYSKGDFELSWKVEQIDGNWWIVAYLGSSTNLTTPTATINDNGEIVQVYGVKSLNYQNVTQLTISSGTKEIGYQTDATNILGSTSNSNLSSLTILGKVDNMTENSILGMTGLGCLIIENDLTSPNSFAPTSKSTWYYYSNEISESVSTYQRAGIYTSGELQRENTEWVVDSDGYIIAYKGTSTELVVPSYLLKQYRDDVIIIQGIKSFKNGSYGDDSVLAAVTSVTITEGIKKIISSTNGAFNYLINVTELKLSSTLTYIGENAFRACEKLEEIRIPNSVNTIEVSALPMDKNLSTIILDGTLKNSFEIPENYGTWFYNSEPMPTSELFIAGTYKKATYNIRYFGNGGILSNGESSYTRSNNLQGKAITIDQNQFINSTNAKFLGWSTNSKGLYVEYSEGDTYILDNTTRVVSSDFTISFYAVWEQNIKFLTLDPNWADSNDPNKGYAATQFGKTNYISSVVDLDFSKDIILTGSFAIISNSGISVLSCLVSNSNNIKLVVNETKLQLLVNGVAVLTTSELSISKNAGYSYYIHKQGSTITLKLLASDGTTFFNNSVSISNLIGTSLTYGLGSAENLGKIIYGSSMLFESAILKLAYLPDSTNGNHMQKITENGTRILTAINGDDSATTTTLAVYKMIPTALGSTLPTEVIPSRFGFEFGGFYYNNGEYSSLVYDKVGSSTLLEGIDNYSYDADITVQAYWTEKPITIWYDANGGTGSAKNSNVRFGSGFTTLGSDEGISRTGYTLIGWHVNGWKDFETKTNYVFDYMKSDWSTSDSSYEITFYAIWEANTYHVTYHPNGGSGTAYTVDIVYNTEFVLLDITDSHINFTMKGHSFDRWRGSNGSEWKGWVGKPWIWTYAQDVTLYAQWTANTYHATYTPNGGVGNDYKIDIVYGQNFVLLDNTDSHLGYTRDGYKFYYWNEAANGSGSSWKGYVGKEWKWTYDYDITLYAQWNKIYDVVYTANGGTGADYTTKIVKTEQFVLLDNTDSHLGYTRTGYTFSYWSITPDGSDTSWKSYINKPWTWSYDYGLTFYAIWTPNTYTVTTNANGGTIPATSGWTIASGSKSATKTVTFDSTYGTLPTPTKTGYAFAGWAGKNLFNKSATAYSTGHYISGNGSTTPYAAYNIYQISVPAGATITIKNSGKSSAPGYAFYTTYGVYVSGANFGGKATVTTTVPSNATYIRVSVNLGEEYRKDIDYFQIEIGSSATAYEAYRIITSSTQVTTPNNHILTAVWKPNTYTITFNPNGGKVSQTTKSVTYASAYGTLPTPTKTGYIFKGWGIKNNYTILQYLESTGTQFIDTGLTMEKSTTMRMEISAQLTNNDCWAGVNGYMQYQANLGSGIKGLFDIDYNGTSYVENVYFNGVLKYTKNWSSSYTESNNKVAVIGMGDKNNTWWTNTSANKYAQSGKWYFIRIYKSGSLVRDYVPCVRNSDGVVGLYDKVEGKFYTNSGSGSFVAGSESTECVEIVTQDTIVTTAANHTLVAMWTPITYTVSYNGNGSTSGSTASSIHSYDVAKNLTANGFVKTGYMFAGWSTSTNGSILYDNNASVKNLTTTNGTTIKLFAVWITTGGVLYQNWRNQINSVIGFESAKIKSITFTSTQPTSGTQVTIGASGISGISIWTSSSQFANVVAYVTKDSNGYLSVVFYCTGKIYFPTNSTSLFGTMTSLASINFGSGIIDDSNTSNYTNMFAGSDALTDIDVSDFGVTDTDKTTGMLNAKSLRHIIGPWGIEGVSLPWSAWYDEKDYLENGELVNAYTVVNLDNQPHELFRSYTVYFYATGDSRYGEQGLEEDFEHDYVFGQYQGMFSDPMGQLTTDCLSSDLDSYYSGLVSPSNVDYMQIFPKDSSMWTQSSDKKTITSTIYVIGNSSWVVRIPKRYFLKVEYLDVNGAVVSYQDNLGNTSTDTGDYQGEIFVPARANRIRLTLSTEGNKTISTTTPTNSTFKNCYIQAGQDGITNVWTGDDIYMPVCYVSGMTYMDVVYGRNTHTGDHGQKIVTLYSNDTTINHIQSFVPIEYAVTLNPDKGEYKNSSLRQTYTGYIGSTITINRSDITVPTGYTFNRINQNGKGTFSGVGEGTFSWNDNSFTFIFGAGDTTLTLEFFPISYVVKFNENGGSGTMADQSFVYGVGQKLTANTFTRKGYTFDGWATSASGSKVYNDGQAVNNLTTTPNTTINLYALWIANTYTVTLNPNYKGGLISNQTTDGTYSGNNMTLTYLASSHMYRLVNTSSYDPHAIIGQTVYLLSGTTYLMHAEVLNDSFSVISSSSGSIQVFYGIGKSFSEANSKHFYADTTYQTFTVPTTGTYNIRIDNDCGQTVRVRNFWIYRNFTYQKTVTYDSDYGTLPSLSSSSASFADWYDSVSGGKRIVSTSKVAIDKDHTLYGGWLGSATISVANSSYYSQVKYSTSDGRSGTISLGGSVNFSNIPTGTKITISAYVAGYSTLCETKVNRRRYGFRLGTEPAVYNYSNTYSWINGSFVVSSTSVSISMIAVSADYLVCCVSGDSLVSMADGTQKQIKDIKVGDKVLSYNTATHMLEQTVVESFSKILRKEIVHITFEDGTILKITPDHPIFSERGWIAYSTESGRFAYPDVELQDQGTQIGDMILSLSLLFDKKIVSMEYLEGEFETYTMKVKDNSNFFAQNVLVHNKLCQITATCCVDEETDITMADGSTKKAKDIAVGDEVLSYNHETKQYEKTTIEETITPYREKILEITFEDGSTLKITDDHPLLSERGWICYNPELGQLAYASYGVCDKAMQAGDKIITESGAKTIASIKVIEFEELEIVYTFKLANGLAFVANGNIVASVPND